MIDVSNGQVCSAFKCPGGGRYAHAAITLPNRQAREMQTLSLPPLMTQSILGVRVADGSSCIDRCVPAGMW